MRNNDAFRQAHQARHIRFPCAIFTDKIKAPLFKSIRPGLQPPLSYSLRPTEAATLYGIRASYSRLIERPQKSRDKSH
jgi:hypothetical protein